jgi:putative DNA primase/helicase
MSLPSCQDIARVVLGEPHHQSAGELYYHCPNHDDQHPSLKINLHKDMFLCGPCGVGGKSWRLVAFLARLEPTEKRAIALWLKDNGFAWEKTVQPKKSKPTKDSLREVAQFYYSPTLRNVRFEAPSEDGKPEKHFQWQHLEGDRWIPGDGGIKQKPLYANHLFRNSEQLNWVLGVEGEGKCEAAQKMNIPAFSYKYMNARECQTLAGLAVVLWPDADSPGDKQVHAAAKMLLESKQPNGIRIICPPLELPLGGDIVDAIRLGWTQERIQRLIDEAKSWPPPPAPLEIIRLSQLKAEEAHWLWPLRIPSGAITILDGDPGTGKSMLCVDIAAKCSNGAPFFAQSNGHKPATVIFLSSEDSLAQTLVPRLKAASADLTKVVSIPYVPEVPGQKTFSRIPRDLEYLGKVIEQEKAVLVVLDVLVSYIPAELSTQRDQDVRLALSPLSVLANRTGVAVLCTRHLNKNTQASALYRGGGSIAIVGAARCSLLLARSPENPEQRTLAVLKSNLGIIPSAVNFTINTTAERVPKIEWVSEGGCTAQELLPIDPSKGGPEDRNAIQDAIEFLVSQLGNGPVPVLDIQASARDGCFSWATVRRAKDTLGIKSHKPTLMGGWYWELPNRHRKHEDAQG